MTAPAFSDPAEAAAFATYRDAQIEEYGTWVAASEIRVDGALAFAPGHPVPKSTLEAHDWDRAGLVVPAGLSREEQLRRRAAELEQERAAIAAELGEPEPDPAEDRRRAGEGQLDARAVPDLDEED